MQPLPPPLGYSIGDAAKLLGVSRSTVYKLVKDERLPSKLLGQRILIPADALAAFFNSLPDGKPT